MRERERVGGGSREDGGTSGKEEGMKKEEGGRRKEEGGRRKEEEGRKREEGSDQVGTSRTQQGKVRLVTRERQKNQIRIGPVKAMF
jgi:ATP-dependent RNA helicase DHX57